MTLEELSAHLQRECYQPNAYHVGSNWSGCSDSYCIDRVGEKFAIFYVERGKRDDPVHCYETEEEACDAFLAELDRDRFSRAHCVGIFTTQSQADALALWLDSVGITFHRDANLVASEHKYSVAVIGRTAKKNRIAMESYADRV